MKPITEYTVDELKILAFDNMKLRDQANTNLNTILAELRRKEEIDAVVRDIPKH